MTNTQIKRGRPVSHAEARAALNRFIAIHFRRSGAHVLTSIPVNHLDDDVTLSDYILEQEELSERVYNLNRELSGVL